MRYRQVVISWAILQEARRRAGLTQRELAERAGTSQSAIARIERGRQLPSLDTLQRLLRACDLDLELRIVPHDTHDDVLLEATLAMTPEERIHAVEEMTRVAAAARPTAAA
jgi:transcriptional regulator with XRE-family HTH domain